MRIHTDHNGVAVNAIETLTDGTDVRGHCYQIISGSISTHLNFQLGGVAQVGVNGLTNEALLAVLLNRLSHLNKTFPCNENVRAISHLEEALVNLEVRTARRIARGVEGQALL